MQKYDVTGMSCAACSARVEKVVRNVDGVTDVAVNLLTNSMNVEGDADSGVIIAAVTEAGYGASLKEDGQRGQAQGKRGASEAEQLAKKSLLSFAQPSDCVPLFFTAAYVCFYGTYDVGLAFAILYGRQSCGNGTIPVAFDSGGHGHQSKVFYQWISECLAQGTEYGYPGSYGRRSILWL